MIKEGDQVPNVAIRTIENGDIIAIDMLDWCQNKKIVLIGIPGAFTPVCTNAHLPGYAEYADQIKAKGVDEIACLAVNDFFVMKAWSDIVPESEAITMLADGNGELTRSMGLDINLSSAGLGVRSRRYVMVIDKGIITQFFLENGTELNRSAAENLIEVL